MGLGVSVLLSRASACCRGSAAFWCYLPSPGKAEILFVQAVRQSLRLEGNFWCFIAADFIPSSKCLSWHPCAEEGLTGLCPPLSTSQHWVCSVCREEKRRPRRAAPSPCHVAATALCFHAMCYEHHGVPSFPMFLCYSSTNIPPGL